MNPSISEIQSALSRAAEKVARSPEVDPQQASWVTAVLAVYDLLQLGGLQTKAGNGVTLPQTFGEWAKGYELDSNTGKFIAAAVYLLEQKGVRAISAADVAAMYDRARWKKPANSADVFAKGAAKQYFAKAEDVAEKPEDAGKWRLTQTGYDYFATLKKGGKTDGK